MYIVLNKVGSNAYLKLPVYGEKVLSGKMNRKMGREIPDTIFHQVKPIALFDGNGNDVGFLKSDSIISVVHLMYANDTGLSTVLFQKLKPIVDRFVNNNKVRFYSISVDTTDTAAKLKQLEQQYVKDSGKHWFVVGSKADILPFVKDQLLIDAFPDPTEAGKFRISNNYLLIDTEGRIRGFYDINLKTEPERLQDEIKVQLVEEARNNPFKIEQK
ncbi:SCO family protein [Sphingobacterium sp. Mn56C]